MFKFFLSVNTTQSRKKINWINLSLTRHLLQICLICSLLMAKTAAAVTLIFRYGYFSSTGLGLSLSNFVLFIHTHVVLCRWGLSVPPKRHITHTHTWCCVGGWVCFCFWICLESLPSLPVTFFINQVNPK